jgi:hypothetical protein
MPKKKGLKSSKAETEQSNTSSTIHFHAQLLRPKKPGVGESWHFLKLPTEASARLPSRGMTSVEGLFQGIGFQTTLEPDGQGGHWMKVDRNLQEKASVNAGDMVALEIAPMAVEPEPTVPDDLQLALANGSPKAMSVWLDITAMARRDWIQWIVSAKQTATRERRIHSACDMLSKGKRRPCCFDRSGMYAKNLSCPVADDTIE